MSADNYADFSAVDTSVPSQHPEQHPDKSRLDKRPDPVTDTAPDTPFPETAIPPIIKDDTNADVSGTHH